MRMVRKKRPREPKLAAKMTVLRWEWLNVHLLAVTHCGEMAVFTWCRRLAQDSEV